MTIPSDMRSSSQENDTKENQQRSNSGRGVCQQSLTGCARDAELTLLPHPALRIVNMNSGCGPEAQEAEESNGGGQAPSWQLTSRIHHGLFTIPKEGIAGCQDSTQWLFQLYGGSCTRRLAGRFADALIRKVLHRTMMRTMGLLAASLDGARWPDRGGFGLDDTHARQERFIELICKTKSGRRREPRPAISISFGQRRVTLR